MKTLLKSRRVFALLVFLFGLALSIYIGSIKGIPFMAIKWGWSIGILEGTSPFDLANPKTITNPVITVDDVTDVQATLVADPFMIIDNSIYYMFFEVLNHGTKHGDIGLAVSSDGRNWEYKQIVLNEPFHLSYPHVFTWEGEYYMIPESYQDSSIRLYKAVNFPTGWKFVDTLLTGDDFVDPSIFRFREKWWLFFSSITNDILRLYFADELKGPWYEHPQSPIIEKDSNIARPGGRVIVVNERIFRFAQDDYPRYGRQVNAFEITKLDPVSYEEKSLTENPILQAGWLGWNVGGMHHIDAHSIDGENWIASVDGRGVRIIFGFEY